MIEFDPTARVHGRGSFTFQRFRVRVIEGPDLGSEAVYDGAELTVGTAPGNSLQLTDRTASRHHCVFDLTNQGIVVRDLGSTNGTMAGTVRIQTGLVSSGSVLGIGQTRIAIEALAEPGVQALEDVASFGPIIGQSVAMRRLFDRLTRIAPTAMTLLIEGETGTGKSAIAETIHDRSGRAGAFVVLDCGAIPASLIESELFGHEKGAFTGAFERKLGLFEAAQGGTIFLDEIGELPLELQPRLLRVLENRRIRRVGGTHEIPVDVRMIAATHRDLRQHVNKGTFRADLWYRLAHGRFVVPPLRERPEDILPLVTHFFRQVSRQPDATPSHDLVASMLTKLWPGNVRELRAAVERAVLWGALANEVEAPVEPDPGAEEQVRDLDLPFRLAKLRAVARWESAWLGALLSRNDDNVSAAARSARMDRTHLRSLLHRHGLLAPVERDAPAANPTAPVALATLDDEDRAVYGALVAALRQHDGNLAAVARELGKDRTQIRRWMRRFGLRRDGTS